MQISSVYTRSGQTSTFSLSSFSSGGRPWLIRSSLSTALAVASHVKKPSRNTRPTIGTLSGLVTMAAKLGSTIDRPISTSDRFSRLQPTMGCTKNRRKKKKMASSPVVPTL